MIINNNTYTPQFGSLRVCENARPALEKLPIDVVQKVYKLGGYLNDTQHVDMEIQSSLAPVIKSKWQREGGLIPPFKVTEPKNNESDIKVTALCYGETPIGKKVNDTAEFTINLNNPIAAKKMYVKLKHAHGDFEQTAVLTKLIDSQIQHPIDTAMKKVFATLRKHQIIDNIFNEFGTWAK